MRVGVTRLLSIDPGKASGIIELDVTSYPPRVLEIWDGLTVFSRMLRYIERTRPDAVVIEDFVNYGRPLGDESRDTLKKIGAVRWACERAGIPYTEISRPEVNDDLCHGKVSKGTVNRVVRDLYLASSLPLGGGANPEKGVKANPGPLYGVTGHAWDALALGVVWVRRRK